MSTSISITNELKVIGDIKDNITSNNRALDKISNYIKEIEKVLIESNISKEFSEIFWTHEDHYSAKMIIWTTVNNKMRLCYKFISAVESEFILPIIELNASERTQCAQQVPAFLDAFYNQVFGCDGYEIYEAMNKLNLNN